MAWYPSALAELPRQVVSLMIRAYQLAASPFPSPCRYTPTCSTFALQAIQKYGAIKGSWLALRRILRCHPFARSGSDPVP